MENEEIKVIDSDYLKDEFFTDELFEKLSKKLNEERDYHFSIGNSIPLTSIDGYIVFQNPDGSITKRKPNINYSK